MLANDVSFIPHIKGNKEKLEKDARKGQRKKKNPPGSRRKRLVEEEMKLCWGEGEAKQANVCQAGQYFGLESLFLSSYDYIL